MRHRFRPLSEDCVGAGGATGEDSPMPSRVRTARRADIPSLARLCRAAVGPHDYVLSYLEEMVAGREVRIVDEGGRIVAMAGITECADGALWLGQLRTHPRFRRRGYATRLLDDAFARVVREGRPALRLWASRRNKVGLAVFEGSGFRRIATFTRRAAAPMGGRQPASVGQGMLVTAGVTRLWTRWRRSTACRRGRGYVDYRWHFVPLARQVLKVMRRRKELYVLGDAACVLWREDGDPAVYGAVLAGGRDTLLLMRRLAAMTRRDRVEVFLPEPSPLVHAARRAGFGPAEWGRAAILFERPNPRR